MLNLQLPTETKFTLELKYREYEATSTDSLRENLLKLMEQLMLIQIQSKHAITTGEAINPQLELHHQLELQHCALGVSRLSRHDLIELAHVTDIQIAIHRQVISQAII